MSVNPCYSCLSCEIFHHRIAGLGLVERDIDIERQSERNNESHRHFSLRTLKNATWILQQKGQVKTGDGRKEEVG